MTADTKANIAHHESFELANLRLRMREGLRFTLHDEGGEPVYLVHDPVTQSYHHIGVTQYAFVSAIDGSRSIEQIVNQVSTMMPDHPISESQAEQTSRWLLDQNLAFAIDHRGERIQSGERLRSQASATRKREVSERANPLFTKVRLGDPGPWLDRVSPKFFWMFSKPTIAITALLMIVAVYLLWQDSASVTRWLRGIVDADSAVWLMVCFVGLKIVHEFGHAVACHRVGGRVRETGVVFILFVPIPYVDVTSTWQLSDRRKRMLVSAAGMMVEMSVASIAAIAWALASDEVVRFHLLNLVLMGTLTTLLFNANFLMRFDGYFLLSDWVGIANLAPKSRQCVMAYVRNFFLGQSVSLPADQQAQKPILLTFGTAAMAWRWTVCVGLIVMASRLFYGFGLVLAIVSVLLWVGRPIVGMAQFLICNELESKAVRRHLTRRVVPIALALTVAACWLPWPWNVTAPAIVQHRDLEIMRTGAAGFIRELQVVDGQTVSAGDLLVTLENVELDARIAAVQAKLDASRIRSRRELIDENIAASQAESAVAGSLQNRLDELIAERVMLEIRATVAGQVVAADLSALVGQYAPRGFEVMQLVAPEKKEILIAVSQNDRSVFAKHQNRPVVFRSNGRSNGRSNDVRANLTSVQSHGQTHVDARLTASAGGDLAERVVGEERELVEPHFEARVKLDTEASKRLRAGTTGRVQLNDQPRSIAGFLLSQFWAG